MQKKHWKQEEFDRKLPILLKRSAIISSIRKFFTDENFLEVETPILQTSPGLEPHLKAFKTKLEEPFKQSSSDIYLHTSPEFAMKKLIVAGLPRIFQMARTFRNEERSATHHPEFIMLEWYRVGVDYNVIMEDCKGLLRSCLDSVGVDSFNYNGKTCNPFKEWKHLSVAEAFKEYAGIDILGTISGDSVSDPEPSLLAKEARRIGIEPSDTDRWEDIYFRIALEKIEPYLGIDVPVILYDYPVCMAALSRQKPQDKRLAERFEVYVCGMELANAFSELTDAEIQRKRFIHDMDLKEELYGERYPIDEDFIDAMTYGMPECAGIALGVDRLVMLSTGTENIEDVLWLPVRE